MSVVSELRSVEPGQPPAEIIGERRQRTAMHMAAVVQMTVIDIEFADQLILVGLGNSDSASAIRMPKCSGMPEQAFRRKVPIAAFTGSRSSPSTNSRQEQQTILQQCEPAQGR
jgi:hypothetical protein